MIPTFNQLNEEINKIFNNDINEKADIKSVEANNKILEKIYSELSIKETKSLSGIYYTILGLVLCCVIFHIFSSTYGSQIGKSETFLEFEILGVKLKTNIMDKIILTVPLFTALLTYHFRTFIEKYYSIVLLKKIVFTKFCNTDSHSLFLKFIFPLPLINSKLTKIDFIFNILFTIISFIIYSYFLCFYYVHFCISFWGNISYVNKGAFIVVILAYIYLIYRYRNIRNIISTYEKNSAL